MRRDRLLLLALAASFAAGLGLLVSWRFAHGDVYPPYSSLRADPLGVKVLHDALLESRGPAVERAFGGLEHLAAGAGDTVLVLGMDADWLQPGASPELWSALHALGLSGARVVVTLAPVTRAPRRPEDEAAERTVAEHPPPPSPWGLAVVLTDLPRDEAGWPLAVQVEAQADAGELPTAVSWHSATCLDELDRRWRVLYHRDGQAVLVERSIGDGTLVLAADSFFLSNEAALEERHTDLLAWVIGPARRVLFDESHLGVEEGRGVALLIRRYRLHGVVLAFLVLAALFVWRSASPLMPAPSAAAADEIMLGRDAAAGLGGLLRRSIPERDLLRACVTAWARSAAARQPAEPAATALAEAADDPAAGYRRIQLAIDPRKGNHAS